MWCHGLTSSRAHEDARGLFDWSEVGEVAEVVRYDARSHGRSAQSSEPDDHRWPTLATDLLAVADALRLDRFVAGGASMGTATALHAAVVAPERVEALVLVIPPTAWATRAAQAELYAGGADLVERDGVDAFLALARLAPPPAVFADEPGLATFDPDVAGSALPAVLRGAGRSDLPDPEALAAISRPALVLAWEGDPGHPVSTAEALAGLLPAAELHVAPTLADVRAWPALVRSFLEALPA